MAASKGTRPASARRSPPSVTAERDEPPPMVEIVMNGVSRDDWVTETLREQGVPFRLLGCRPSDRDRPRLLRLFEVGTSGPGVRPLVRRLRSRLGSRDIGVAVLSPDRALLRVSVPLPPGCATAFELGDFCINCPFLESEHATESTQWNVLVPRIGDARRLLRAMARRGAPRPTLVRAGGLRARGGLTGRQEKALRLAYELGYFDYPRRISLGALAARLGVGRSTTLELMRKATTRLAAERFGGEVSPRGLP